MGKLFLFSFLLFAFNLFSQSSEEVTLFAQCHFEISNKESFDLLQSELKTSPFIKMARLDWHTQRAIFLTQNIINLSEEEFKSWFGEYSNTVRCIQIGIHGVDPIAPYPFQNCAD